MGADDLGLEPGAVVEARLGETTRRAKAHFVGTYADAKPSELVLVVDSYGLLCLAADRASAATECGLRVGSAVDLVPRPT